MYLCVSPYECAHTDTCLCEFNLCSSCLHELVIWRCFNLPAVWCKLKREVNKQECSNSRWVVVCLLGAFCLFLSLCVLAITNKIYLPTIMNCTVCVGLGKIMIIKFTVIDPAVFRHVQLTLITHLTVRIKNQMLTQFMQNMLAIRVVSCGSM